MRGILEEGRNQPEVTPRSGIQRRRHASLPRLEDDVEEEWRNMSMGGFVPQLQCTISLISSIWGEHNRHGQTGNLRRETPVWVDRRRGSVLKKRSLACDGANTQGTPRRRISRTKISGEDGGPLNSYGQRQK